jgi:hypothetical protein
MSGRITMRYQIWCRIHAAGGAGLMTADVAAALGLVHAHASSELAKLSDAGFLRRKRVPSNGRRGGIRWRYFSTGNPPPAWYGGANSRDNRADGYTPRTRGDRAVKRGCDASATGDVAHLRREKSLPVFGLAHAPLVEAR